MNTVHCQRRTQRSIPSRAGQGITAAGLAAPPGIRSAVQQSWSGDGRRPAADRQPRRDSGKVGCGGASVKVYQGGARCR